MSNYNPDDTLNSRRRFLKTLSGSASIVGLVPTLAAAAIPATNTRRLSFHHLHTGESLHTVYWHAGNYDAAALSEINRVLRDFRTGEHHPIAPDLLDLLHTVQSELGCDGGFQVIGGYRSPKTNDMLRKRSSGVAKRSLHMQGRAIDVRLPGIKTSVLREVAADLKLGGVGYYRKSDFVHLDTGRPRVW